MNRPQKLIAALGSRWFFRTVLGIFGLESLYIACTAGYPMVFDENTQFGVIKLYAHHLSPIFLHQPANAAFAGPLTREPSYLYQYLLSFPYRLLSLVTNSQMAQVIGLRIISIGLFGLGLVLFRRLLLLVKVPASVTNVSLLFIILLPVVPLLAGQINYDNLVMPVAALALWLTVLVARAINNEHRLPFVTMCALVITASLGSLVQFEFLPILVAIIGWLGYLILRHRRALNWQRDADLAWQQVRWPTKIALGFGLVISIGLFLQMYSVNIIRYHNPTPSCSQVLSPKTCSGYAPWERNAVDLAHKSAVNPNPIRYTAGWAYRMFNELFYTSSGGASPQAQYLSVNPLPVPFVATILAAGFSVVLVIAYGRRLVKRYPELTILCGIAVFYSLLLLVRNYQDYLHIGQKIAINGRYILPVMLPVTAASLLAYREFLRAVSSTIKIMLGVVGLLLMLQGGGAVTYIVVSNSYWYWPNHTVIQFNQHLQQLIRPLLVDRTPLAPRD